MNIRSLTDATCLDVRAWDDYRYWQDTDKSMVKRINRLVEDCTRHPSPFEGIGKPETLKHCVAGS